MEVAKKWKPGARSDGGEKFKYFSLRQIREGDTGYYSCFKDVLGFVQRAEFD